MSKTFAANTLSHLSKVGKNRSKFSRRNRLFVEHRAPWRSQPDNLILLGKFDQF